MGRGKDRDTGRGVNSSDNRATDKCVCGGGGGGDNRDRKRPLWITEKQTGGHEQGYQSDGQ